MPKHTYPYLELPRRQGKPRKLGRTMVHDSGIGPKHLELILESAAPFIDYYKFRTFTHALHPEEMTLKKIALLKEHDIKPFMGGNVAELALVQGTIEEHVAYAKEMGWAAIEFSETYVTFQYDQKIEMIKRCAGDGLEVIYEWGLKKPAEPLNPETAAEDILKYIEAGVEIAVIEEGEIDMLIGKDGEGAHPKRLKKLFELVGHEHLMVECGTQKQIAWFMMQMGSQISIGNVECDGAIELEPLRHGIGRPVDNFIYRPYLNKK